MLDLAKIKKEIEENKKLRTTKEQESFNEIAELSGDHNYTTLVSMIAEIAIDNNYDQFGIDLLAVVEKYTQD